MTVMASVSKWYMRVIGPVATCGLTVLVAVANLVDLRRGLWGPPWLISSYLVVELLVILACGPAAWSVRRTLGVSARWMVGSGTALGLWALLSAVTCPRPTVGSVVVPRPFLVMPALTCLTTIAAALAVVMAIHSGSTRTGPTGNTRPAGTMLSAQGLWWPSVVMICAALLQWPRAVKVHGSMRLATGMGGSAVIHVALLLACAVTVANAMNPLDRTWRRRVSGAFAGVGALAIVATGSRAGLVCLLVFGIGLAAGWSVHRWGQGHGREDSAGRPVGIVGAVVVLVAAAVAIVCLVPGMRRILNPTDPLRSRTVETGLGVWSSDLGHIVLGHGFGRLWPWYVYDSHMFREPWRGMITTAWGPTLNSAHSTFLAVLVELGLVGVVLLIPVLVVPLLNLLSSFGVRRAGGSRATDSDSGDRHGGFRPVDAERATMAWGAVSTLPAFLLDTYLLKNFGISLWWWIVALATTGARRGRSSATQRPPSTSRQNFG